MNKWINQLGTIFCMASCTLVFTSAAINTLTGTTKEIGHKKIRYEAA